MEPAIKYNFRNLYLFYFISLVLFIFTAVIIVYYSLGYRYDFEKNRIFQTGILRLEPIDPSSSIAIDHKPVDLKKISKITEITNLLPKTHTVEIQSPGFQSWSKTIEIQAEKVTNIQDIILIPEHPRTSDQFTFLQIDYNPENNQLAYSNLQTLNIANINNPDQITTIEAISPTFNTQLKWIGAQLLAIINSNPEETDISVVNPVNGNISQLTLPYPITSEQIIGINPVQSNFILIFHDNRVISYDLNNKLIENTLFENVISAKLSQFQLYLQQSDQIEIYNFTLGNDQTFPLPPTNRFFLSPFPEYIFIEYEDNISVYDLNQSRSLLNLTGSIKNIASNKSMQTLLYSNHQIVIINFLHQPVSYQIILNSEDEIIDAKWLNNQNIIFVAGHEIRRVDIEGANNQLISSDDAGYSSIFAQNNKINAVLPENDQSFTLQTIDLTN